MTTNKLESNNNKQNFAPHPAGVEKFIILTASVSKWKFLFEILRLNKGK